MKPGSVVGPGDVGLIVSGVLVYTDLFLYSSLAAGVQSRVSYCHTVEKALTVCSSQPLNVRISRALELAPGLGEFKSGLNGMPCCVTRCQLESEDRRGKTNVHVCGDGSTLRWFQTANQDQGFEAGVPLDLFDGHLNRQRNVVDVAVPCKLATKFRHYRIINRPLYVPVLSNQAVSIRLSFNSPRTTTQDPLFVDPALECCRLVGRQQTAFPLHDSHVELQPTERYDTPTRLDKGT